MNKYPFKLRQIQQDLLKYDSSPLIPALDVPWDTLSKLLSQTFNIDDITIDPMNLQLLTPSDFFKNIGSPNQLISLTLSPLDGSLHWIIADQDIVKLMSWMLAYEDNILHEYFKEGFHHYIILNTLNIVSTLNIFKPLTPHLSDPTPLPQEPALVLDISLTHRNQSVIGRLLLSSTLREAWISQSTKVKKSLKDLDIMITAEAGKVQFSYDQLNSLSPGDFIVLDSCTINPETTKGSLAIKANNQYIASATISEKGKIIITANR